MRYLIKLLIIGTIALTLNLTITYLTTEVPIEHSITRIKYADVNLDVQTSPNNKYLFLSCTKPTRLTLVSTDNSVIFCDPINEVTTISDPNLKSVLILGDTPGTYTKIDLQEIL